MKILIYTNYRTGSKSLGEWLSNELNCDYYHEPLNQSNEYAIINSGLFDLKRIQNCIVKVSPGDGFDLSYLNNVFDKIIILYRENTLEQSESMCWSIVNKIYHHHYSGNSFKYAYYDLSDEWKSENMDKILELKNNFDKEKEFFKSLEYGLQLSYEELYYSDLGIKLIEDYIGFVSKAKINPINKLRGGTQNKRNLL